MAFPSQRAGLTTLCGLEKEGFDSRPDPFLYSQGSRRLGVTVKYTFLNEKELNKKKREKIYNCCLGTIYTYVFFFKKTKTIFVYTSFFFY